MVAQVPELLQGTFLQWLPWQPDELAGVPTPILLAQLDGALSIEPFPFKRGTEGVPGITDIALILFDSVEGICATGTYRADLFTANTIERFVKDLRACLEQVVHSPGDRMRMCSEEEAGLGMASQP
jgi:hypothetical protein